MCTAISFLVKDHYFGRNLDYEHTYNETVTITPRNFSFGFSKEYTADYAMIGMATVADGYPLYYEATNEKGLSAAGLNFPNNAKYHSKKQDMYNIAPFDFIPWIVSQCGSVKEARRLMQKTNIAEIRFSEEYPISPLHWMIADRFESVTVESTAKGIFVYDNPIGVLTNNPPFEMQMFNLNNYMSLSNQPPQKLFSENVDFDIYSRGLGALGLPGDLSSQSRFVKTAFTKLNSVCGGSEQEAVNQFFHILYSVYQQRGCVDMGQDLYEITNYTSCCNTDKGIYYYTTYENSRITAIDMNKENLNGEKPVCYPLNNEIDFYMQN